MTGNESLRNFILQKVIKKVRLNKKTFSFVEDQTELSDKLLSTLINECAKYGFKESDARTFITQTANNIAYNPSIKKINQNITINDIAVGQHFCVHFRNKHHGILSLNLVCLEQNCFFVNKSSIPGIASLDIINSMQQDWNIGFDVTLRIERNGKQHPNEMTFVRIGSLESIDLYLPSFINILFDSEEDYSYEGYLLKSHTTGNKYVNTPRLVNGRYIFSPSTEDDIPKDSIFVICPNDDKDTATLLVNTEYINELLRDGNQQKLLKNLCCCAISSNLFENEFKTVIMEEPGVLQCNDLNSSEAFWFITAKPIISFCQ